MPNFHIQKGARKGAPASTKFPSLISTARSMYRRTHKQMVHGEKKQHHQIIGGIAGGQKGGAIPKTIPNSNHCNDRESCYDYALGDNVYMKEVDKLACNH